MGILVICGCILGSVGDGGGVLVFFVLILSVIRLWIGENSYLTCLQDPQ